MRRDLEVYGLMPELQAQLEEEQIRASLAALEEGTATNAQVQKALAWLISKNLP